MPALFALGQRSPLQTAQEHLQPGELLFAFLDNVYALVPPARVRPVFDLLEQELRAQTHIQLQGKTRVWNASGTRPPHIDLPATQAASAAAASIRAHGWEPPAWHNSRAALRCTSACGPSNPRMATTCCCSHACDTPGRSPQQFAASQPGPARFAERPVCQPSFHHHSLRPRFHLHLGSLSPAPAPQALLAIAFVRTDLSLPSHF